MGIFVCPKHGRQQMAFICEHLVVDESVGPHKVEICFSDWHEHFSPFFLCAECKKKIGVTSTGRQTEDKWENLEEFNAKLTNYCCRCIEELAKDD